MDEIDEMGMEDDNAMLEEMLADALEGISELVAVLERAEELLRDLADYAPPGEYRVETINLANECKAVSRKVKGDDDAS